MFRPCTVILVIDDPIYRTGLELSLQLASELRIAGSASSLDAISAPRVSYSPLVVILDYASATGQDFGIVETIRRWDLETRIVILADRLTDEQAFRAWQHGASAFVTRDSDAEAIIATIRRVASGEPAILDLVHGQPRIMQRVLQQVRELGGPYAVPGNVDLAVLAPLTDRELEVLRGAANGLGNRAIATSLAISQQTVKNHLNSACRKLGLNDRTQAVLYALRRGWVAPPRSETEHDMALPVVQARPERSGATNVDA